MTLSNLLERLSYTLEGARKRETEITSIIQDSRKAENGSLFIAVKGTTVDGHSFIPQVIEAGAVAVVCDKEWWNTTGKEQMQGVMDKTTFIVVDDCNLALAMLASAWNGYPSEQLTLVGVTGTNGKTTIATLLYRLFTKLGYPCGLLSTVCNYVIDREVPATHTTPDPLELNDLLRQMVE